MTKAKLSCAVLVTKGTVRWCSGEEGPGRLACVYSLLFIEDDDQIRLALSLALEDEGYRVTQAENGATGRAAFADGEFDLVLLDLRLPDLSGFEVCRAIR